MKENFDKDEVWMEELSAITPCTEEENARLLSEIKEGKAEARERLIEGNLKGVLLIV